MLCFGALEIGLVEARCRVSDVRRIVNRQVLAALARVLQLDIKGTEYLHQLAGQSPAPGLLELPQATMQTIARHWLTDFHGVIA